MPVRVYWLLFFLRTCGNYFHALGVQINPRADAYWVRWRVSWRHKTEAQRLTCVKSEDSVLVHHRRQLKQVTIMLEFPSVRERNQFRHQMHQIELSEICNLPPSAALLVSSALRDLGSSFISSIRILI